MRGSRFVLVEQRGYSEREVFEANDLEEMVAYLEEKTGRVEDPEDRGDPFDLGIPEVNFEL